MSRRVVKWIVGLSVIDAVAWALTIHTSVTYHRSGPTAPLVMPLGELLGWIVSGVLLVLILVIVKESRR